MLTKLVKTDIYVDQTHDYYLNLEGVEPFTLTSCMECVKALPVFSASEIKESDHIMFAGSVYDHHAIVVSILSNDRTIIKEKIKVSFDGNFKIVGYDPSIYDTRSVVKRALSRLGEQQFDFFTNDSSHFTRWCKLMKEWERDDEYNMLDRTVIIFEMTFQSNKIVLKRSSVDVLLDYKPSSKIKDDHTTCIGKSENLSTLGNEEKQLDNDNLQRTRSIFSVKENIRRPTSIDGLIKNKTSIGTIKELDTIQESDIIQELDTIQELGNDTVVDASLNDSFVSEQNSYSEGKKKGKIETSAASYDGGCIECVKAVPVFNSDAIDEGDHIVFAGMIYDHHAIVVKKLQGETFEIVEATNTGIGLATGVFLCRKALI
ncbi:unnamed protein product [Mytilus coruscus]|uniref:Uncharacterized protein n=1 Tax=Mytilus coruscus TaxID=42192 RepID=A0A6J8BC91_MYTCO|nr:unnamed protein product [Mytilus coruscus]